MHLERKKSPQIKHPKFTRYRVPPCTKLHEKRELNLLNLLMLWLQPGTRCKILCILNQFQLINVVNIQDDLNTALEAIRGGMPVQKAATEFGIPSGTLYGRCKKVGIELSKNTQVYVVHFTD